MKKGAPRHLSDRTDIPKILVIYGGSQYPARKSTWSHLYSFRKYAAARVYYHNEFFVKRPWWVSHMRFDAVVFHNSVTTPWSRERYPKRIARYEKWDFGDAYRIGLFQDEFHNADLLCDFVNRVRLDKVCTVAPESEWKKIYRTVDFSRTRFEQVLTGYIDPEDLVEPTGEAEAPRPIDLGYRSEWTPALFRTGTLGYFKHRIAAVVDEAARATGLRTDITTARGTALRGEAWFDFVRSCRFFLGVESGSGLLDWDGSIERRIVRFLAEKPGASFEETREHCFREEDGNLHLQVISPRHLEAAVHRTGQVLIEGTYSGIFKAHVHYIPLKADFSNLTEVLATVRDEPARKAMVERAYRDIVISGRYDYRAFVQQVLDGVPVRTRKAPRDEALFPLARFLDGLNWTKAFFFGNAMRTLASRVRRTEAN